VAHARCTLQLGERRDGHPACRRGMTISSSSVCRTARSVAVGHQHSSACSHQCANTPNVHKNPGVLIRGSGGAWKRILSVADIPLPNDVRARRCEVADDDSPALSDPRPAGEGDAAPKIGGPSSAHRRAHRLRGRIKRASRSRPLASPGTHGHSATVCQPREYRSNPLRSGRIKTARIFVHVRCVGTLV